MHLLYTDQDCHPEIINRKKNFRRNTMHALGVSLPFSHPSQKQKKKVPKKLSKIEKEVQDITLSNAHRRLVAGPRSAHALHESS